MEKVRWSNVDGFEKNENYDLCGKFSGEYIDVVQNSKKTWDVFFDNVCIKKNFGSRSQAKEWADTTNLINEVREL